MSLEAGEQVVTTDERGRFRLFVRQGTRPSLDLRADGDPLWRSVDAHAVWTRDTVEIQAPAGAGPTARLVGQLTDHAGEPLRGARLYLQRDGATPREAGATDDSGEFSLGPLHAGHYDLFAQTTQAELPSAAVNDIVLRRGEERRVVFRAHEAGVVEFDLRRADGEPIRDVVLTFVGGKPRRRQALQQRASGSQVLLPGRYQLWVMGDHIRWVEGYRVVVRPGKRTRVRLDLEPAVLRSLKLRGLPSGVPGSTATARCVRLLDGAVLWKAQIPLDAPRPIGCVLPVGTYVFEVRTKQNELWSGTFNVPDVRPRYVGLPVQLHRTTAGVTTR